jgi:hypothetical protein
VRSAKTPFGKIVPQYATVNGIRCSRTTLPTEHSAMQSQTRAIDHSVHAAHKHTVWITAGLKGGVSGMRPMFCALMSMEKPPWPRGPRMMKEEKMTLVSRGPCTTKRIRYTVIIIKARERPMIRRLKDTAVVSDAHVGRCARAVARRPPVLEATIRVTTGNSQRGDIWFSECWCLVILTWVGEYAGGS